jgi:outer membrane protein OmpA-like peptidoglycan-associated protein
LDNLRDNYANENKDLKIMKSDRGKNPESHNSVRFARAASAVAAIMLLAGCSAVPDWTNPVKWYDGVVGSDSNTGKAKSKAADGKTAARKTPGDGKGFPNLASVPERPKAPTEAERKRLADSLNADRDIAKYSDEVIKRQSAASAPSPPPAPAAPSSTPRPPAAPAAPAVAPAAPRVPAVPAAPSVATLPPLPGASPMRARPPAPAGSVLSREPVSRPPQFAAPPPSPVLPAAAANSVAPRTVPPSRNMRSIARVGNPSFGAPPADIAAALGGGSPPQPMQQFAPQPQVPGTFSNSVATANGAPAAMVRFKAGSAQLTREGSRLVQQIAGMYRQRGGAVRVEGHASSRTRNMDPVQHHLVNFNVSLNRANAVANELVRQGVPSQSVFVAAMSDSQPLFYEVMPAGDAGNQRVEIHFVN